MKDELLDRLTILSLEEKSIRRNLDSRCFNKTERANNFKKLEEVQKEIKKVKFKLKMERELKNEKFREKI